MSQLTDQQQRAISARDVSVALSAGAGCGKTFVLTERFLSCLEPTRPDGPVRLDQLTAITFTERAAREMRGRIRAACTRRLMEAPEEQVEHWLRTIRDLQSARISTIHAFCGSLLRGHAVEARLDPRFEMLDPAEAETLLYELIDDELRERLARRDEAVMDLVVQFGLRGLREMVERLLHKRQEIDWAQWRTETPDGLAARWEAFWRSDTLPRVLARVGGSAAATQLLRIIGEHEPSNAVMRERCARLADLLPRLAEQSGCEEMGTGSESHRPNPADTPGDEVPVPISSHDPAAAMDEIREAARVQGGGGKKAWPSEEVYEAFRDACERVRKEVDKVKDQAAFDAAAARPAAEIALRLLGVAEGVARAFQGKKEELAVLDFDDLLVRARDLIVGPGGEALRKRLAMQTRLLLVDEFQDTDPLQVELVKALCDGQVTGGKLFFVGDYKQSIYRFRGADPHVFRRLRDEIPAAGRLPLSLNFRSQPAVLDFINALFRDEMGPEYEPLRAHRQQVGPAPAVELLWAVEEEARGRGGEGETESGQDMPATERRRRREADWIARRIRGMIDEGERLVWDEEAAKAGRSAARAVRPGDVALLFRALTNVEYYEAALRRHGIDYYLVGGHAFYAQQEVYDIVNLLRTLASPCDEVSLAGVLRSPMFGLLDETLFWLAQHPAGLSAGLFSQPCQRLDSQQRARVEFAAATVSELRAIKDRVPIAELLQEALARTGYDAALLAEFLGERKLANLHKLIDQARAFDASGIFTLADFITQLAQFVARQPDEPLAAVQPESINAVRLMSIHQSKGLEFPVVFVVDVDRPRRSSGNVVAFTPELGPMVRMRDGASGYDLFARAEADEDLAELTRLLYVATTRAADYLVLSSGLADLEAARGPWMELLARGFDLATGAPRTHHAPRGVRIPHAPRDASESVSSPPGPLAKVTVTEPPLRSLSSPKTSRTDLPKLIEEVRRMAALGDGQTPADLAAVPPDPLARRQYSFSRLRGTLHARHAEPLPAADDAPPEPAAIDPLGLGTLVHGVLEELAASRNRVPADVAAVVRRHAHRHLPDADGNLDEPTELVRRFLASPRWAAVAAADEVHAELEFLLAWPPGVADPNAPYLQGFIDCLYRDAGGWRLLDYKTNRISPDTVAEVAAGYEMQMLVYALAVERVLGQPPQELVLHFLREGLEHRFTWDAPAAARAVELVSGALTAARQSSA